MNFPFVPNQIIVGNPESPLAICCGWTPREKAHNSFAGLMERIACIGQLYTAERGVDLMVRNLLAVPSIKEIILTGNDRTGVQGQLQRAWVGQFAINSDGNWQFEDIIIGGDIPASALSDIRKSVTLWGPISDGEAKELLQTRQSFIGQDRKAKVYPPVRKEPDDYPAAESVHVVRGKTVGDVYLKILYNIMTFGERIHTHYDQDSKEIMDLVSVVTEQEPEPLGIPTFMPFSVEHLTAYRAKLMNPEKDPNVTYTYGNRMRAHFGMDQIEDVVAKISKEMVTRSAVISLWDSGKEGGGSPCLNHIWFRVRNCALHMTATIRSNDMFFGWPENAYGLRYLQEQVRQMILPRMGAFCDDGSLSLGDLVINSQSAHIYEDCWAHATKVIKDHYQHLQWWDEKGQWTFERDKDGVVTAAELFQKDRFVTRIEGTPAYIRGEIARRNLVSDIGHALYVGAMLEKRP